MDGCREKHETGDAVIIVENEAESMPVQEDKSGATTVNFLDTCPVCHLNFHSREPKLLPCLHSFCKKCLPLPSRNLAMPDPPSTQVDSATKPLNVIRCPVCRQECMEVDVMENFFVRDSVEAPSSTVERTVQLCMTCDDNTVAVGFCVDCVEYLCVTCVEAHQRVKFTKDHVIRQKEEVSQEAHGVSAQRPVFCDIHKQEPLKLFCETCDMLTCRDCQLLKHKDHNYQFLEDAYNNHKQHMEGLTTQLQEKKKVIEEVSSSINNGLQQVDQNRMSVHNEIKKSICSLILEINKKGKILVNQLEGVTKDHETVLKKQQEDIGYLSRHLDHVISFTKWATARNGGTALLYCKHLILFQIGNLLRAKCSTSFVPQSSVRFQCRSSYWASNVDLGSLVVENVPGHQLGGVQGIPHQLPHPGQGPSGSPSSLAPGPCLASHNTLAQLQMQVEKLNPQPHWQPQPPPPPWTWYQSVRLPRTVPRPHQGGSPSQSMPAMPPQPGRRFMVPPPSHLSPTSSLPSPGFTPQSVQPLRGLVSSTSYQPKHTDVFSSSALYTHSAPLPGNGSQSSPHSRHIMDPAYLNKRIDPGGPLQMLRTNFTQSLSSLLPNGNAQGQQNSQGYTPVSQEEKPGTVSWKPSEAQQANRTVGSAAKRRRRSSPGPIIVIKDEPEDDISYIRASQRASLPDSTDDQPQNSLQAEGEKDQTPPQSTPEKPHTPPKSPRDMRDQQRQIGTPNPSPQVEAEQQTEKGKTPVDNRNEDWCAVCQNGGELLRCFKCPKVFHLTCHVPTILKSPSGEWFCSLCRDLSVPELEYNCDGKPGITAVKEEPDADGRFPPVDKRKCERLLLWLFCNKLSPAFRSPVMSAENRQIINTPIALTTVKSRLEAKQSPCYQSLSEFVSDIRSIFRNHQVRHQADTEVAVASRKLEALFEEQLKTIYPDQTFPQIKMEVTSLAAPSVSSSPSPKETSLLGSHDAPGPPKGQEETV